MKRSRALFLFVVLLFSVPGFVWAEGNGGDCGKLIQDIRGLGLTAFNEFPSLKDIQQNMLLILYARERATCPSEIVQFSTATQRFLTDFESVYVESSSLNASGALISAERIGSLEGDAASLSDLQKDLDMVEAEGIAVSAKEVLIEFLTLKGEDSLRFAEDTLVTREKIGYYTQASIVYSAAGEALASTNARIMAESLDRVYKEDMTEADALYSRGSSDYKKSIELLGGSIFSKVDAYVLIRSALINFRGAERHYSYHLESEKLLRTEESISGAEEVKRELRNEIALYFSVMATLLVTTSSFLIHRLKEWNQDSTDSSLGNELIMVGEHEI